MTNDITMNFSELTKLFEEKSTNNSKIDELKKANEEIQEKIKHILKDDVIREFICKKLQEGIDKFNQNAGKSEEIWQEYTTYVSNSSSTVKSIFSTCPCKSNTFSTKYKNPNGIFNPFEDDWELQDIKTYDDGTIQLYVNNIKGIKTLGVAGCIYDIYHTDKFIMP